MLNKEKIKKIIMIITAFTFIMLSFKDSSYASSINISSNTSLQVGGTCTISISGSDVSGRFNISLSNGNVVSLSKTSIFVDNGIVDGGNVIATAKAAGTTTLTLIPIDVTDSATGLLDLTSTIGSKSVTLTVKSTQTTTPTNPTPTNNTTTTTKSNNANLKKLVPNYEGMSPNFNPNTTKYSLTVPASVNNLGLTVAVDGAGAKYWIDGQNNLKLGDNTVTITVTAADGTKKVYTIIVTKAADVTKANAYLSSIVVDGKTLNPSFAAEVFEYSIEAVAADVDKLTVLAHAQSDKAKVEISGNDGLVAGENTIKIKVTAEDGVTVKEYSIKVNKEGTDALANTDENNDVGIYDETNSLQNNTTPSKFSKFIYGLWMYLKAFWLVISLFIFCLLEFAQILYLYLKLKKINGSEKVSVLENKDVVQTRRRNNLSQIADSLETNNEENAVDDISDELVEDSKEKVTQEVEDNLDNFEDTKDMEEVSGDQNTENNEENKQE